MSNECKPENVMCSMFDVQDGCIEDTEKKKEINLTRPFISQNWGDSIVNVSNVIT